MVSVPHTEHDTVVRKGAEATQSALAQYLRRVLADVASVCQAAGRQPRLLSCGCGGL